MKTMASFLLLLAGAVFSLAGTAGLPVQGRVFGPAGHGIAGARVELRPISSVYEQGVRELAGQKDSDPVARAVSRADGGFEVRAPGAGLWRVDVAADGYVPMRLSPFAVFTEGELPDVQLAADLTLRVRVESPGGRPVADARVRALTANSPRTPFVATEGGWSPGERAARTGRDGEARLPSAAGERLVLWVAAPGFPVQKIPAAPGDRAVLRLAAGVPARLRITELDAKRPTPPAVLFDELSGLAVARVDSGAQVDVAAPERKAWNVIVAATDGRWGPFSLPAAPAARRTLKLPAAAVVSGHVADAADAADAADSTGRTPLPGALVWPRRDPSIAVRADAKGAWRLPATRSTWTELRGAAAGHFPAAVSCLAGPGKTSCPTLLLAGAGELAGQVVDEAGRPVADAEVRAILHAADDRELDAAGLVRGEPPPAFRTRTSPRGELRFSALWSGWPYDLLISHPGFATSEMPAQASLAGRPSRPLRIVLPRGKVAVGKVADEAGRPIAGAEVELTRSRVEGALQPYLDELPSPDDGLYRAVTDPQGGFSLAGLPAGSRFDVTIHGRGFTPLFRRGLRLADLGTFVLEAGAVFEGLVTDPEGRPLAGAEVWSGSWGIQNFRADPVPQRTGEDGRFTLRDFAEGAQVFICHPGHLSGGGDISATSAAPFVLAPAARISGRVVGPDGDPVPGVQVTAHPVGQAPYDLPPPIVPCVNNVDGFTGTDEEGRFMLDLLPAGWYDVRAQATGYRRATSDRLHAEPGRPLEGVEVILQPETEAVSENPPEPPREQHEIRGTVLDPAGVPVASARVEETATAADGSFVLRRPDGDYFLKIEKEGFAPAWAGVEVRGQEAAGVEVRLSAGATVSGRVLGLHPDALRGAVILAVRRGQERVTPVEEDGSYRLEHLAPGSWNLHVAESSVSGDINLAADEDAVFDLVAPPDPVP
jgi:protocatechuate 3,4-dioxygenase beta subunit